jgi:hypothetical protein
MVSGCQNEKDEKYSLSGESASWASNIEVTFSNSGDKEKYFIGGNLKFKKEYSPPSVKYYLSYPSGEGNGTSEGKEIKIPRGGGTREASNNNIEKFAKDITLNVQWEDENGKQFKEKIPLD